jgi:hypothetical protein
MAIPTTACGNGNPTDALCYGNTQLPPVVMVTLLTPCAMATPTNALKGLWNSAQGNALGI